MFMLILFAVLCALFAWEAAELTFREVSQIRYYRRRIRELQKGTRSSGAVEHPETTKALDFSFNGEAGGYFFYETALDVPCYAKKRI